MPTTRAWLVVVPLVGLLAGCGGDDGGSAASPSTETTTLDPGVTFDDDVTVPTTPTDPTAATTTSLPDVVTEPGEVPDDFPDDFPVPDGAEVEVGSSNQVPGEARFAVDLTVADEDPAAVLAFYRDAVTDAGYSILLDDENGSGAQYVGTLVFETDTYVGNVLVSGDGGNGVLLSLTATLPD